MTTKQRSKGSGTLYRKVTGGAWIAAYFDYAGQRRVHSTRTTDKATAQRILTKLVSDTALRRDGVINPRHDRYSIEGRKPLTEHIAAYQAHCQHAGRAEQSVFENGVQLDALLVTTKATRLVDLTADALELHLTGRKHLGLSARTINRTRAIVVAFVNWCVKTGRLESNPLGIVPKQDELRDRRRVRRALTDAELSRLIEVARPRGREAWYLAAAFAGLRKGDLQRLVWVDVNFQESTITIRTGKAKRVDVIPMHPQLADALVRHQQANPALPMSRVWSQGVQNLTRQNDFKRAGIALVDSEGRVADLHALRATLATQLARNSVTPQVAQRILRHSDYRTTMKHYTMLGLVDTAAAISKIPNIKPTQRESAQATGTEDVNPTFGGSSSESSWGAKRCKTVQRSASNPSSRSLNDTYEKNLQTQGFSHNSRDIQQRTRLDSNQRPSVSKTDALSTETLENKAVLNVENREVAVVRAVETENATQNTTNDPDLVALFEAWATLPAAIKVGIMAMVRVGK